MTRLLRPLPSQIIDDVFGGELRSTIVCLSCKRLSCTTEPFLDLSLPVCLPVPPGGATPSDDGAPSAAALTAASCLGAASQLGARSLDVVSSSETTEAASGAAAATASAWPALSGPTPATGPVGMSTASTSLQACLSTFLETELLDGNDAYECDACAAEYARKQAGSSGVLPSSSSGGSSPSTASGAPSETSSVASAESAEPDAQTGEGPTGSAPARARHRQPAMKLLQVTRAPQVLTLHIKRFSADGAQVKMCSATKQPPDETAARWVPMGLPSRGFSLSSHASH